jgi:hypothetical protein
MENQPISIDAKQSRVNRVFYWILTGYLAFESVLNATWDFNWLNKGFAIDIMKQIGFPTYFLYIKGIGTLLAAPVFLLPRLRLLKEWAYFGTFLTYMGAITSHLFVQSSLNLLIAPFIFLCITVASWALRPPSRRFTYNLFA